VTVDLRMGLLRDTLRVDGREYPVQKGREGWRQVVDPAGAAGRVRYDSWRDRILIESPAGSLQIRFRWRNTTFAWQGRTYRITSMVRNRIQILDGDRPVVVARSTWSGVRLESLGPEFRSIERELAIGLSQRLLAISVAVGVV
jgi:hypothetical protein